MSPIHNTKESESSQPLIAGMYARVSTGRQEQEETIESQLDEIKSKIEEDGNILPSENVFVDDGWSGEIFIRPELDKLRDAIRAKTFQVLYVYDRGRIARKFAYQEIVLEELINAEIQFITLHDSPGNTPEEKVLQAMQGVFAEYERIKIYERFRRGKLYKAKSKILINGHSLYGYNYIKKTEEVPAHYEINEEETRIVRMIFEWVGVEQISLREVIRRLYDLGIPPRKHKSEFWTKGPIVRLLQCEAYSKGKIYYNKSEAVVPKKPLKDTKYRKIKRSSRKVRPREEWYAFDVPTILEDNGLFEKVQEILSSNQKYATKNRKYEYLLTSKVYCTCGSPRAGDGSNAGGHHYYRCAERIYKFPKEHKCKLPGVNAEVLDKTLWDNLLKFMSNPVPLQQAAEEYLKFETEKGCNSEREEKQIAAYVAKIQEEEKRYAKAYGTEAIDFESFKDLMKECKKRTQSYTKQLKEIQSKKEESKINPSKLNQLCQEARKVLELLDISNKIQIVRDLIDKVTIKEDRKVEVLGHIPLMPLKLEYEPISRDRRPP
ncbi:MAG: recombinase family protein [Patescibacteria group bacterium]